MFAVVRVGQGQYRVKVGDQIMALHDPELKTGDLVSLPYVNMVG